MNVTETNLKGVLILTYDENMIIEVISTIIFQRLS